MKLTIQDGRDSFYTFDSNRILLLTATDEEQINQVEFSTEEAGGTETWTKDVLEQEDGVKFVQVPNEFLNGDYTRLVCYAVALDSKGEFTRQKEVFRIKYRPQPEDWFLTYSERVTFASIKALTEQYKSNASDSAELASKYAENNEDVAVESGKYSAKHWSIKSNKKYEEIRSYVGSASDPKSALGSIESARANAVSDVEKQESDSIEAVGTYTSNTAIPSVSQYVEGTAKPALNTYGEQQVDSYVNGTSKPELDRYVNNEKKQVLDEYTAEKKTELDIYTSVDKKQVLDSYTENEKKTELDSHTVGLKEQLDAHTVAKAGELNEYTTGLKSELDGYTTAKEQDISEFTEQKKSEVQGVYQNDFNELKGDLNNLHNEKTFYINSSATSTWVEFEVHAGVKYRIYNNTITDSSFLIRTVDAKGSGNIIDNFGSIIRGNYIEIIPTQDAKYWWITLGVKDTTNIVKFEDMSKRITQIEDNISKINKEITFNNIITVKKDGKGDFTTIRGAVDSIKDASADNPYTIEVYEGVYNVLEDYTDEEIRQSNVPTSGFDNNTFVGVKLTDGISIRGIGARDKIILNGELDPAIWDFKYRRNISTLNLDGDCNVENLTIVGSQLRYCIHDDFSKNKKNSFNRKVINVILKPISVTSGIAYGGGGAGGAMYGIFENCDFGNTFAFHSNPNKSDSDITLVNCKGAKISLDDMGSNCYVKLQNCSFDYICLNDITSDHIQKMFLYGCGNDESIVVAPSNYVYETGNISKVYPSGKFTVGNVVRKNLPIYSHEFELTNNHKLACGVIVFKNTDYVYIQTSGGFTSNTIQSLLGGSLGDYITVNENNELTYSNANADNAIAIVTSVDTDNVVYARLLM